MICIGRARAAGGARKCVRFVVLVICAAGLLGGGVEVSAQSAGDRTQDPHGDWRRCRDFERVVQAGTRVIELREERTYFAFWLPPDPRSARVLVSIHGTGGNPFLGIKDELPHAQKHGLATLAIKWFDPEQRQFFDGERLYRCIERALDWLAKTTGNDLSRVAYCGFSRGAAVSYEIAWLDRDRRKFFDLVIAHSGGVPQDGVVAPKEHAAPDSFFTRLLRGELGAHALDGCAFFLYSGDRDEQWGAVMSQNVQRARDWILRSGGVVVEWVRQADGGHQGYLKNPALVERAMTWFERRTP